MSLFDKIKNLMGFKAPKVQGAYDTYRRQRLVEGGVWGEPYYRTFTDSISKELNISEWRRVNSAARKMYWNNGMVNAAIDQKSMLTVGSAMRPIFVGGKNEEAAQAWGKEAERVLLDWFQICYVDGKSWWEGLRLESTAIDRDGDLLTILTTSKNGYPQLQQVPWHQIGSRFDETILESGPYKGLRMYNGVILSKQNRAVAYRILGEASDGSEDRDIPAQSCMLTMDPRESDQVRGISAFAPAIRDLLSLKDLGDDIQSASRMAAKIGLLVTNQQGMADASDAYNALTENAIPQCGPGLRLTPMAGGRIEYLTANAGESINQIDAKIPTEAQDRLQERLIRNALLAAQWPPEFGWDMSKLGGASARIILEQVNRITSERHAYLSAFCKRRCAFAIARFVELGILPPYPGSDASRGGAYQFRFTEPARLTADSGYASRDAIEAYRAGMRSMTDILASGSKTLEEHLDEVEREELEIKKRVERSGLTRDVFGLLTPNGNPATTTPPAE
jgi:capsid protein